jgi:glycosyltransferase involved in cell wall biosynthesis
VSAETAPPRPRWNPRSPSSRSPRILHVPTDVAGNAFRLSRAERELGLQSTVAVLWGGRFGYDADIRLDVEGHGALRQMASRVALLRRALRNYDIIHFNFGQTFFAQRMFGHVINELPLFKRAGKTILVTFQGCDVRPWAYCYCRQEHCYREDRYRLPNAAHFLRYADRSFHVNPDLKRWLPGSRFLPYTNVDPRVLTPSQPIVRRDEVVVAHAPTSRAAKGTHHVLSAIQQLQGEGLPIRLDLIELVSHEQALDRLRAADIVVDQLLMGWYGGLGVEAMALAKPVLCDIDASSLGDTPFGAELPIVPANQHTIVARLRELVNDRDAQLRIGAAGRAFVERWHDPRAVAREVLAGIVELSTPA